MKTLCRKRHETIVNLADEFGVSKRTIRRDIDALCTIMPIYIKSGRYDGGIYVVDNYTMDRIYMTNSEIELLKKIYSVLCDTHNLLDKQEADLLKNLIKIYSFPVNTGSKDKVAI